MKQRNATVTTIAPTGTLSILAGCSSGVEPLFAVSFVRNVMEGTKLLEVNPYFEKVAKERGFWSRELMEKIAEKGSLHDFEEIPEDVKAVFLTAHDISPMEHIATQAAFQKYVDNAVSKTVNFSHSATTKDVGTFTSSPTPLGCKGVLSATDRGRAGPRHQLHRQGSGARRSLLSGEDRTTKEAGGDHRRNQDDEDRLRHHIRNHQ
jgi:ribonucleoside-diphosphate reductase alpha chain